MTAFRRDAEKGPAGRGCYSTVPELAGEDACVTYGRKFAAVADRRYIQWKIRFALLFAFP